MNLIYQAPEVKVVEIMTQTIICQSGGINSMSLDEDEGNQFN